MVLVQFVAVFGGVIGIAGIVVHFSTKRLWQIVRLDKPTISSETGETLPPGTWAARKRVDRNWVYRAATDDEIEHENTMWAIR